jgi:endoglucanase
MKKKFGIFFVRIFGIIALGLIISFSMTACGGDDDNSDKEDNDSATPATPQPFNDITAAQLVAKIKIGWNLGNTLDTSDLTWLPANPTVAQMETAWSNPVTTKANITALKNAGFNAIRIPVSWTKAADANYNIRTDWMARVVEIVNYAVNNDMYILLNTHHDEHVFPVLTSDSASAKAAFKKIWEQIADTFKNYNEKLIFEGLNEPRTIGSAAEWSGGTAAERSNLNAYYPIFVNTVRNSGGNNGKRILLINTYAASGTADAINGLVLPTDTVQNKIIVSMHVYAPYNFALNDNPVGTDGSIDT